MKLSTRFATGRGAALAVAMGILIAAKASAAPAYQGMSYTSFSQSALGTAGSDQSLMKIQQVGADTVALNFWWFQDTTTSTTIAEDFTRYSSTVSSIEHAIDTIHGLGMKVLLKPMLDVKDGTWRANINPAAADRDTWFANYTNYLGTFADIAQTKGVELFSIGCEMNAMENATNNARWTSLIANMRGRYNGQLTYAANHDNGGIGGGYAATPWWDQLDVIGIDAYFPLTGTANPTQAQLEAAWTTRANQIESFRTTRGLTNKQVIFTEVGLCSFDGSNMTPWATPGSQAMDEQEQATAYDALLTVMSQRPWWDGAFWWNWETNPNGAGATSFTPQYKLASGVLAEAYGGVLPAYPLTAWNQNTNGTWGTTGTGWSSGAPTNNSVAQFDRGNGVTYAVSLSGNRTTDQIRVGSNTVTFQSSSATARTLAVDNQYTTEDLRGVVIGLDAGDVGVVNVAGTISSLTTRAATLGDFPGSAGTLNLTAATTVFTVNGSDPDVAELIVGRGGGGTLNISGGADVNVTGASASAVIGQEYTSAGLVTVSGAGSTLVVTNELRVGLGGPATLAVAAGGLVQAGTIVVGGQALVQGVGTLVGAVQNGGVVAPGSSPGTLTVTGSFAQAADGELQMEIASATSFDKLSVSGAFAFDGNLYVTFLDDYVPAGGTSFDLLDFASHSGAFNKLELPELAGLLRWDASQITTTGVLAVIARPFWEADFDENGVVDALDLIVLQTDFGMTELATHAQGDADGDGDVDGGDLLVWQRQLGNDASAAAAAPEPAAGALAAWGVAAALAAARRRRVGR